MKLSLLMVIACGLAVGDTAPVADESLRTAALEAVFPGMQVTRSPKPSNFRVVGPPQNKAEECASEDLIAGNRSNVRDVELTAYRWPTEGNSGLVAVLQYSFLGASPAGACWSIGLLVHLVRTASGWSVQDRELLELVHHSSLPEVRMVDLTGDGFDELIVESNTGGAGAAETNMHVFDLGRGAFAEILNAHAFLADQDQDGYKQKLDIGRTLASRGAKFCFMK